MFSKRPDPTTEALVDLLRDSIRSIQETNARILEELTKISEAVVRAVNRPAERVEFGPLPEDDVKTEIDYFRDSGQISADEAQRLLKEAGLFSTEIQFEPSSYPRLSEVLEQED